MGSARVGAHAQLIAAGCDPEHTCVTRHGAAETGRRLEEGWVETRREVLDSERVVEAAREGDCMNTGVEGTEGSEAEM